MMRSQTTAPSALDFEVLSEFLKSFLASPFFLTDHLAARQGHLGRDHGQPGAVVHVLGYLSGDQQSTLD